MNILDKKPLVFISNGDIKLSKRNFFTTNLVPTTTLEELASESYHHLFFNFITTPFL
jgi:hypothetical protein